MDQITFIYALGLGTMALALVCVIILCILVGFLCKKLFADKKSESEAIAAPAAASAVAVTSAPAPASAPIPNRKKILAAVCAVIAEENGCDVNAIRVKSFKKI